MIASIAEKIRLLKTHSPEVWDLVLPKVYKNVERFNDYRLINIEYAVMFCNQLESKQKDDWSTDTLRMHVRLLSSFQISKSNDFPLFFVENSLLDAATNTQITFELDWREMPLPFEGMTFIFPKNNHIKINKREIAYLNLFRSSDKSNPLAHSMITDNQEGLTVIAGFNDTEFKVMAGIARPYNPQEHEWHPECDKGREEAHTILNVAFNLLFAMAARPELVENGRKLGKHKKSNSEIWTPNIIGRKYTVKTNASAFNTSEDGHTKRLHWRRGHFRHQPFGKGLTETRVIWLEPVLVGVKATMVEG